MEQNTKRKEEKKVRAVSLRFKKSGRVSDAPGLAVIGWQHENANHAPTRARSSSSSIDTLLTKDAHSHISRMCIAVYKWPRRRRFVYLHSHRRESSMYRSYFLWLLLLHSSDDTPENAPQSDQDHRLSKSLFRL